MTRTAEIIGIVAGYRGVPAEFILSPIRLAEVAHARQEAMYLIRQDTPKSLPQIGQAFYRDHTTVLHAIRQVERRMEGEDYRATIAAMCDQVKATSRNQAPVFRTSRGKKSQPIFKHEAAE